MRMVVMMMVVAAAALPIRAGGVHPLALACGLD